jgi:hypothetical protein
MTIPQVKNPIIGAFCIFVGLPLLKFGAAYYAGTIHHWGDIKTSDISDATFHSFWAAVFWVFFKSPWAPKITQFTSEAESISASGVKTAQKSTVTIEQPADSGKNV